MSAAKIETAPVGTVWDIKRKTDVVVAFPDGSEGTFPAVDGSVQVVLDRPGVFTAGTQQIEAV